MTADRNRFHTVKLWQQLTKKNTTVNKQVYKAPVILCSRKTNTTRPFLPPLYLITLDTTAVNSLTHNHVCLESSHIQVVTVTQFCCGFTLIWRPCTFTEEFDFLLLKHEQHRHIKQSVVMLPVSRPNSADGAIITAPAIHVSAYKVSK